MAGLFSLGGGGRGTNQQQQEPQGHHHPTTEFPPPDTPYWYKNEDATSYRGFELWNQQFMSETRPSEQDAYSSGVGASRSYDDPSSSSRSSGMMMAMRGGGGISCQDCGNKAKKDCPHMRCRTCCKSRGFHCQTHIKSTWVSAPKRRERQQQVSALHQQQQAHPDNLPRSRHRETGTYISLPLFLLCSRSLFYPFPAQASLPVAVLRLTLEKKGSRRRIHGNTS